MVALQCVPNDRESGLAVLGAGRVRRIDPRMSQRHLMSIAPLRETDIRAAAVRLGDNRVNKLVTGRFGFALRVQSIAPIPLGRFPVGVDGDGFGEPGSGRVKMIAAIVWFGSVRC